MTDTANHRPTAYLRSPGAKRNPASSGRGWPWGLSVVLVLLIGGGATWWQTGKLARLTAEDDQRRFTSGGGNRLARVRDVVKLYGADLKRLAAVLSWAEPEQPALEAEFRRLLVEDSFKSLTEWGVLECAPDPADAKQRLRPVRVLLRVCRSAPGTTDWAPQSLGSLEELSDDEHRRAIRHLQPDHELALAVWAEAPGEPVFRLFATVPAGGKGGQPARVLYGTIRPSALMEETFGESTDPRGVRLALHRGDTNRPARLSAATRLIQGVSAPSDPPPHFHAVVARPLMGFPMFWELYSSPLFEQRGSTQRVQTLRTGGWVLTALFAVLMGVLGYSRARHIENERRLERLNAALEQEQRTRQWLTSNLHDGILQDLIVIANFLPVVRPQAESPTAGPARARAHLQATVEEIRRFMQLTEGRLPAGSTLPDLLREQVRRDALRHEATVVMEIPDLPLGDVPEAYQFELWLAAREAMANVVKHGEATQVSVQLARADGWLTLNVSDDGQGFDPSGPMSAERRGLRNLRNRAAAVGGELRIESGPGKGTSVTLRVPVGVEAKPAGDRSS